VTQDKGKDVPSWTS